MVREVLRSLGRKPATQRYPYEKAITPERFRGKIKFTAEKCIGCRSCMRDCPAAAITITKVGEKRFEAGFDLGSCIYCAQCVDSCPKDALESTRDFELAQLQRAKLKVVFDAPPPPKPADPAPAAKDPVTPAA